MSCVSGGRLAFGGIFFFSTGENPGQASTGVQTDGGWSRLY